jgi:hypothetical protein
VVDLIGLNELLALPTTWKNPSHAKSEEQGNAQELINPS